MKSPRFVERALAFCLPGLIAVVPALQAGTPRATRAPERVGSVSVWHKEVGQYRQSVDAPMVVQVRTLVEHAFAMEGPNANARQRARAVLSERYGRRMMESSSAARYVWWWDPVLERWFLLCYSTSTFEIDFGRRGTVVVEATDTMPLD